MPEIEELEQKIEIEEKVVQIDRVTRVVKGGRRLRFRAIVVVGDRQGKVGVGVEKASEVVTAIEKASTKAKKFMKEVPLVDGTIPHEIVAEYAGAKVFLKPAKKGTGVIAGGAVRAVLDVAGVKNILSKIQGSSSKLNNVYATLKALNMLMPIEKKVEEKKVKPEKTEESEKPAAKEKPAKKATPAKKAVKKDVKEKKDEARSTKKASK